MLVISRHMFLEPKNLRWLPLSEVDGSPWVKKPESDASLQRVSHRLNGTTCMECASSRRGKGGGATNAHPITPRNEGQGELPFEPRDGW